MAGQEKILNGRYALVAQQGSGGMSVIYKAVDRALGRTVAVKILRPSLTTDPTFLDRFRNEARAVANLSHPNIVTVYDVGSDGPTQYIVMELVEGQDLKRIIKTRGALPFDDALELAIQICAGIGYAHRSGLVHADVKPQNILVTPQNVVKVTDFGIAQALSDTIPHQRAEIVWGSPHYFAPEQARGEKPDPQSDVYAAGIVLFEMLTGNLPYSGTSQQDLAMAHIREPIPDVRDFHPNVPERLAGMIKKAMAKNARDRFRDADQFGNVLRDFQRRSQDHTAINNRPVPSQSGSSTQSQTAPRPQAGTPTGQQRPDANSDVTARYSAAPNAPQPYHPRQQQNPSVPSPAQPPQPFEQRYVPPPPQQQQQQPVAQQDNAVLNYPAPSGYTQSFGDSAPYPPQYSQPMSAVDDEGIDFVTIALAIMAVVAVGGLILLWIIVLASL